MSAKAPHKPLSPCLLILSADDNLGALPVKRPSQPPLSTAGPRARLRNGGRIRGRITRIGGGTSRRSHHSRQAGRSYERAFGRAAARAGWWLSRGAVFS